jgi:hypothetical protein
MQQWNGSANTKHSVNGSSDPDPHPDLDGDVPATLFRCLLFPFGEREALHFFPASRAFLNVVSTLAVTHKF